MNISQIRYHKTRFGKIQIEEFQGVATLSEIRKDFGLQVEARYCEGKRYYQLGICIMMREGIQGGRVLYKWRPGDLLSREEFAAGISHMKEAAKRLIEIRKEVKKFRPVTKIISI